MVVTIYTVISNVLEFQFRHILVNSWHFQATEDVPACHIVGLICISLMTNEIENHFALASWVLLLSKVPTLTGFANFYNLCIIMYVNYIYIIIHKYVLQVSFPNSVAFFFACLMIVF